MLNLTTLVDLPFYQRIESFTNANTADPIPGKALSVILNYYERYPKEGRSRCGTVILDFILFLPYFSKF